MSFPLLPNKRQGEVLKEASAVLEAIGQVGLAEALSELVPADDQGTYLVSNVSDVLTHSKDNSTSTRRTPLDWCVSGSSDPREAAPDAQEAISRIFFDAPTSFFDTPPASLTAPAVDYQAHPSMLDYLALDWTDDPPSSVYTVSPPSLIPDRPVELDGFRTHIPDVHVAFGNEISARAAFATHVAGLATLGGHLHTAIDGGHDHEFRAVLSRGGYPGHALRPLLLSAPDEKDAQTEADQLDRARLHRKLVKKGRGERRGVETRVTKHRPTTDLKAKEETTLTRGLKACMRCHIYRIRCFPNEKDPQATCLTCLLAKPTMCRLPCIRTKITDIPLFRTGSTPDFIWSRRWLGGGLKDISTWQCKDTRFVDLTQDHGDATSIKVAVKKFTPMMGDVLSGHWLAKDGTTRSLHFAPYALADVQQTSAELRRHIAETASQHVEAFSRGRSEIMAKTFAVILAEREHNKLLYDTLQLWVASRLIEKPWRVCGDETLEHDISDPNHPHWDEDSPYYAHIPITPVMDMQLDQIVIKTIMIPLKKSVQRQLQTMVEKKDPGHWFVIYLCSFVLLNNYEIATAHDRGFALRHSLHTRFSNYPLLEGFHLGAKTLLMYFHYCCKADELFKLGWSPSPSPSSSPSSSSPGGLQPDTKSAKLSEGQKRYMGEVAEIIRAEGNKWKALKTSQECDAADYFVAQLFDHEWVPTHAPL